MADRNAVAAMIGIALIVAGIDQFSKIAVTARIGPQAVDSRFPILGEWVELEYAANRGAAFGVLSGTTMWLALLSVVILAVLLLHFGRQRTVAVWQTVAFGLVVGGAVGNLIDRVRLGYVVDFIAVGPWPNFNVADSAICLGVAALLWGSLRLEPASPAAKRV